jgi:uncharacterized membrane protein
MQKADEENRAIAEEEKKRGLRIGEGALAGGAQFLISSALGLPMLPAALSAGKTAIETAVTPEATPERAGLAGISAGLEKGLPYLEKKMATEEEAKKAKAGGLEPFEITKGQVTYRRPTVPKPTKPVVPKKPTTVKGMTESQAKQRVSLFLSKSPSLYGVVTDDAAKNGWLSAFNKLKAKGYID